MPKSGYLTFNKSNGKVYLVIRRSKWKKTDYRKGIVLKKTIYSFGSYPKALEKMIAIRNGEMPFPEELVSNGFTGEDLKEWINKTKIKMA